MLRWSSLRPSFVCARGLACALALAGAPAAQFGSVASERKIAENLGGFAGALASFDLFGYSLAAIGDLDGDGVNDLLAGAPGDDAVWVLWMNSDGSVASEAKFVGGAGYSFGASVASLGDSDNDGKRDVVAGDPGFVLAGQNLGAVNYLSLNADGTLDDAFTIVEGFFGFGGNLDHQDGFGQSVAALGDVDGDGVGDLAVGAYLDDDGGTDQGAVWILFMNPDGTVADEQKISATVGGFGGDLDPDDGFGVSLAGVGDLDGDGVRDLAVGAPGDDDGGNRIGAVWILFLNADGTVDSEQKISDTTGGLGGALLLEDGFGFGLAALGDVNGDGIEDLAVGAHGDDDGGVVDDDFGAVWILFLDADGTVGSKQKISQEAGGFGGVLGSGNHFAFSLAAPGDLDGDGHPELAVGAYRDDHGGTWQGAVWMLSLRAGAAPPAASGSKPSPAGPPVVWPSTADRFAPAPDPRRGGAASPPRGVAAPCAAPHTCLSSADAPRAGEVWTARVDLSAHPGARASLLSVRVRANVVDRSPVGGPRPLGVAFTSVARGVHAFAIPAELAGLSFSAEARILDGRGGVRTNALELVVER